MIAARIGNTELPSPVMTASGTAGHSDELAAYIDLADIGAVVVKSMASFEWPGNPAPRVHAIDGGMINAVGLQGAGATHWIQHELPRLVVRRARVVASIWGHREADYAEVAAQLAGVADQLIAVEVNLSCPNLDHARRMFAHDPVVSTAVIRAVRQSLPSSLPVWAKLSPNTDRLVEVARAVSSAGADALVLVNTVLGMHIDVQGRRPTLGNGGGGLSGSAIHAVAVRSVYDVHAALPTIPIVGVGGISRAEHALELMMAGASAVQVGSATFADPRAIVKVQRSMMKWAARNGVNHWSEITGAAH